MKVQKHLIFKLFVCLLLSEGSVIAGECEEPQEKKKSPQIIFINGPSSSGKSSLAQALQEELKEPFLHIGIDTMISMMPSKINDWNGGEAQKGFSFRPVNDGSGKPRFEVQSGPFAKKVLRSFEAVILSLIRQGHSLIIDDVVCGKKAMDSWRCLLKNYQVLWVGVKVSLEELEARERCRGDRMVGSARDQYFKAHEGVVYDVEVDTSRESLEENAARIVSFLEAKKRDR